LDEIIARRSKPVPDHQRRRRRNSDFSDDGDSEVSGKYRKGNKYSDGIVSPKSDLGSDSENASTSDKEQKTSFFSSSSPSISKITSFLEMNLSRPLLRSLSSMSFEKPTPIQAAAIPVGLLGKDIVGAAVTGSGKTAAFLIPVLERLIHRDKSKHAAASRCLILVPTRELAIQCFEVGKKLASCMDLQYCLVVGRV
jgi:ATP-dependent RNA helicase DDX27